MSIPKPSGRYRWTIVAVLFFATTINYIDRNVLSFTMVDTGFRKEMLGIPDSQELTQGDLDEFKTQMGFVDAGFKLAYALGFIVVGFMIDRIGTRKGKARKVTMLICALCVVPIFFASTTNNLNIAIGLIALAAAAHQGWSANIFTTVSDMFPKSAVASVVGIGGLFGAIGGTILAAMAGIIRVNFGYFPLFLIAALAYLTALLVIHLLVPNLQSISIKKIEE